MTNEEEIKIMVAEGRYDEALGLYRKSGTRYHVSGRNELVEIVRKCVWPNPECDLNWVDVSGVTDMHNLFEGTPFNGDVSEWQVGQVTDMDHLFRRSAFRGDISKWDLRNVDDLAKIYC